MLGKPCGYCATCDRIFQPEQCAPRQAPTCSFCGPGHHLRIWYEYPTWMCFAFGWGGLLVVARLAADLAGWLGFSSLLEKQVAFYLLPALLLVYNSICFLMGLSTGSQLLRRTGAQMLVALAGFACCVGLLGGLGFYHRLLGYTTP